MRISKIKADNFKSLVGFEIDLAKFNCIVGLNGSGKSTFLQFVSFLSQLMTGNVVAWFQKRKWTRDDIVSLQDNKTHRIISFQVHFHDDGDMEGCWQAKFPVEDSFCCVSEKLTWGEASFEYERSSRQSVYTLNGKQSRINFNYQGSIFSQLADGEVTELFGSVVAFFRQLRAFDLLSPYFLKQTSKTSSGTIGFGGEDIAAFLFSLDDKTRASVIRKIQTVYPAFSSFTTSTVADGSQELRIHEHYHDKSIVHPIPARNINDGLLRIIAMLSQLQTDDPFLLFDEIENGINQELVEFLLNELVSARQQIVVTTHSPLFLNYLDDDVARESVHYFYKTPEGFTRSMPFFSLPTTGKKLGTLGPGEAISDTNLYLLNDDIESLRTNTQEKEV